MAIRIASHASSFAHQAEQTSGMRQLLRTNVGLIKRLEAVIDDLFKGFEARETENKRIEALEAQNKQLRDQLALNSQNSSKPPSTDFGSCPSGTDPRFFIADLHCCAILLIRLLKEKSLVMACGMIVLLLIFVAIFADTLAPYPFYEMHLRDRSASTSPRDFISASIPFSNSSSSFTIWICFVFTLQDVRPNKLKSALFNLILNLQFCFRFQFDPQL